MPPDPPRVEGPLGLRQMYPPVTLKYPLVQKLIETPGHWIPLQNGIANGGKAWKDTWIVNAIILNWPLNGKSEDSCKVKKPKKLTNFDVFHMNILFLNRHFKKHPFISVLLHTGCCYRIKGLSLNLSYIQAILRFLQTIYPQNSPIFMSLLRIYSV